VTLFRQPNTPTPASFSEGIRRANAALPEGMNIAYRPSKRGRVRQERPYRVLWQGKDIGGAATQQAAIFLALQHRGSRGHA